MIHLAGELQKGRDKLREISMATSALLSPCDEYLSVLASAARQLDELLRDTEGVDFDESETFDNEMDRNQRAVVLLGRRQEATATMRPTRSRPRFESGQAKAVENMSDAFDIAAAASKDLEVREGVETIVTGSARNSRELYRSYPVRNSVTNATLHSQVYVTCRLNTRL